MPSTLPCGIVTNPLDYFLRRYLLYRIGYVMVAIVVMNCLRRMSLVYSLSRYFLGIQVCLYLPIILGIFKLMIVFKIHFLIEIFIKIVNSSLSVIVLSCHTASFVSLHLLVNTIHLKLVALCLLLSSDILIFTYSVVP